MTGELEWRSRPLVKQTQTVAGMNNAVGMCQNHIPKQTKSAHEVYRNAEEMVDFLSIKPIEMQHSRINGHQRDKSAIADFPWFL